ncbi:DUF3492 domain-containing protein [Streptomyces sp. XM4193]|uniref:DUF3492 domain-containing protein n=1 Tax=Streptomyces sp. XM4193 TaxID=2929782 RepID=UPI001FF85363|nr:DUF3492 domain-containing protein [Streptomyces sp. XM4193]MCK1796067.1 DUF3492 domain-containing protein [Streptomyces sp. XM4193]
MRIALLTEGGYPYARGESVLWCDRLVRGLGSHEFEVYALSRGRRQEEAGWYGSHGLPAHVRRVRTAPLWGEPAPAANRSRGRAYHGESAERFAEHFSRLAHALCAPSPGTAEGRAADEASSEASSEEDRFADALYGLADLAAEHRGLGAALRSEQAVRLLEAAAHAPSASRVVRATGVSDLLAVLERLERALRPLSLDWYGPRADRPAHVRTEEEAGLAGVDLCHAVGGGLAALPGLLARRSFGTPLLITEYGVRLREHHLESLAGFAGAARPVGVRGGTRKGVAADGAAGRPVAGSRISGVGGISGVGSAAGGSVGAAAGVRALLGSFQRRLAVEAYRRAEVITPGNAHARGWQERCGAERGRLRTVYSGMDAAPFVTVPDDSGAQEAAPTLVWVGQCDPARDVRGLLHAFARVRADRPGVRLLLVETRTGVDPSCARECRELADRLFPPAADGQAAVEFAKLGDERVPTAAEAYARATVVVRSSAVEGFPPALVEAMFSGRAIVCTDVGAAAEVIGGTGLLVPPGRPEPFADACLALLADPERRARLGAAARARAMELFTVEQNVAAFHGIYLELISRRSYRQPDAGSREPLGGEVKPFARTADGQLAVRLVDGEQRAVAPVAAGAEGPSWAAQAPAGVDLARAVGAGSTLRGEAG